MICHCPIGSCARWVTSVSYIPKINELALPHNLICSMSCHCCICFCAHYMSFKCCPTYSCVNMDYHCHIHSHITWVTTGTASFIPVFIELPVPQTPMCYRIYHPLLCYMSTLSCDTSYHHCSAYVLLCSIVCCTVTDWVSIHGVVLGSVAQSVYMVLFWDL